MVYGASVVEMELQGEVRARTSLGMGSEERRGRGCSEGSAGWKDSWGRPVKVLKCLSEDEG